MPCPTSREPYKIIHDPVHGSIKLEGLFLDLSQAPELQRLHGILQLGLATLVVVGARRGARDTARRGQGDGPGVRGGGGGGRRAGAAWRTR